MDVHAVGAVGVSAHDVVRVRTAEPRGDPADRQRAEAVSVKHSKRGRADDRHAERDVDEARSAWFAEQRRD